MSVPPRSKSTARRKLRAIEEEFYDENRIIDRTQPLFFSVAHFRGCGSLRQRGDKYLVYPASIHIHDLEIQAVPFEPVCRLWHASKRHHDKPAECLVFILMRQHSQMKNLFEFIHLEHT